MNYVQHRKQLVKDPNVKKELEKNELEYQIARALIKARLEKGLTQKELADLVKTRQSVISRVENANTVPSLSLLKRFAKALDTSLVVNFT